MGPRLGHSHGLETHLRPLILGLLYTRSQGQCSTSIPIGAKVEIGPKGFTLRVKAEIEKKKTFQSAAKY
jgi:hypothetical protein